MAVQPKLSIDEKDKPFILALIASALFVIVLIMGAMGAYYGITALTDYATTMGSTVTGFMTMAWTYYLVKNKSDKNVD